MQPGNPGPEQHDTNDRGCGDIEHHDDSRSVQHHHGRRQAHHIDELVVDDAHDGAPCAGASLRSLGWHDL